MFMYASKWWLHGRLIILDNAIHVCTFEQMALSHFTPDVNYVVPNLISD